MLIKVIKPSVIISIGLLANIGTVAKAQEVENQFRLDAQLRPRFEIRDGAFRPLLPNEKTAALISDRMRINFNYQYKDVLEVKIAPQSVSVWGQGNMVQGAENSGNRLAAFEAWSKLKLAQNTHIKLGRQVISLDDERFFGELDWAQGGRAHDALALQYHNAKTDLRGYFAYNQNYKALYGNNLSNPSGNAYNTSDALPYKWMQSVWLGLQLSPQTKLSFIASNLALQNASSPIDSVLRYSQTIGSNLNYKGQSVNLHVAAYYQGGRNITGQLSDAYMLAASFGKQLNNNWILTLGSDWLSGNDMGSTSTKNTAFNPYFHTGHKFYGNMDYYLSGSSHQNVGLSDTYLKINYNTLKNTQLVLALHQFYSTGRIQTLSQSYESNLGQEFDLSFTYKINKFAGLSGGYSGYFTTPSLNLIKSTVGANKYQQWGWLSINVNPTLLNIKF